MERMEKIETELSDQQNGFRKGRSNIQRGLKGFGNCKGNRREMDSVMFRICSI